MDNAGYWSPDHEDIIGNVNDLLLQIKQISYRMDEIEKELESQSSHAGPIKDPAWAAERALYRKILAMLRGEE